jgi:hypothetical protein
MGVRATMSNFNFGEVLSRAWKNIWKYKVLWIFGILASCARGGSGGSGGGNSSYRTGTGGNSPFSSGQFDRVMTQAVQYIERNLWIIIVVVIALILISLIFYALGMMGRIGLIKGTSKAETNPERISFAEIWVESMPYFWRIFGLNFLLGLVFLVIFIPFILLGVLTAGIGFLCLIPIICVLIPISWVLTIVIEQAQAAIVLEDLGLVKGFARGWEVVKSNAGPVVIMALILMVGGAIIGVIIALPIIIAVVPIVVGVAALDNSFIPVYIALACCLAYLPLLIIFNGFLTAYIQSVWVLTYIRLTGPKESVPLVQANA